jgi:hypothetical protein
MAALSSAMLKKVCLRNRARTQRFDKEHRRFHLGLNLVLFPQKLQGDIGALELSVQEAVIWFDELGAAHGGRLVDAWR